MRRILVSACLLGEPVRYDGAARAALLLPQRWRDEGRIVGFCPECAAGLPTPRPPAEIAPGDDAEAILDGHGRVREVGGGDVTAAFVAAAHRTLAFARANACAWALLVDRSPSCGSRFVHAGRFDGALRPGLGLTAALLRRNGIAVFAEAEIAALAARVEAEKNPASTSMEAGHPTD